MFSAPTPLSRFHTGYDFNQISRKCRGTFHRHKHWNVDGRNAMQFQNTNTSYQCACIKDLHGNVMYVIRTLNSVFLSSLFLDMLPPRLKMSFGQRNIAIYIHKICKWHLGSRGNRVVDAKEDNIQLKTLTLHGKYSVSKYTEASTVQIYKIVSCGRGWTPIYPALSVFYACIVLKIVHTISKRHRALKQQLGSDVGKKINAYPH